MHRSGYHYIGQTPEESGDKKQQKRGDSGRLVLHSNLPPSPIPAVGLVGRESALARLRSLLARVRGGKRQVVFITGEAGIGKTSLVEVFLKEAISEPQVLVARGQCLEQYGSGEAYLPVLEAISRLCQEHRPTGFVELLRRQAPTWLQQLPWLLEDADWESLQRAVIGATRERMLREMAEALESLTAETPLVFVLEDLHWGDYRHLIWSRIRPTSCRQNAAYCHVSSSDVASDHPQRASARVAGALAVRGSTLEHLHLQGLMTSYCALSRA
jgi:Cdc6-like AAA superfamily ATPase